MKRTFFALSVLTGISVALQAQSTPAASQKSGATGQSDVIPGPGQTAAPPQASTNVQGQQSWPGVLMDASCPAIEPNGRTGTSGPSTGVTTYTGSTGKAGGTTTIGGSSTPGPNEAKPPLSRNTTTADVAPARSTSEAGAQAPGTAAGSKAGNDNIDTAAASSTAGVPGATGERSRTAPPDATTSSWFTAVRDKYRDCMAKSTSTAYAVYTEGGLIVLDEAGNLAVRQAMLADDFRTGLTDPTGNPRWMSVTLKGSVHGDKLTVTTVGR